ncbi:hypothetical protein Gogos_005583 [Gossypium gossypioides]|uniref:Retrotransposon gag domain-containing protein n=1 Tax=Gossypium gossypioides TaxID=34282 RepID=A0A7J9CWM9_GOSGO|nr:hypothetical protein [Gossypium gossypioides]
MHYRSLLNNFKKNDLSMSAYLVGIKHLCDSLASCNQHASLAEQQSVIVNGLPPEFDHIIQIFANLAMTNRSTPSLPAYTSHPPPQSFSSNQATGFSCGRGRGRA